MIFHIALECSDEAGYAAHVPALSDYNSESNCHEKIEVRYNSKEKADAFSIKGVSDIMG